MTVTAETEPDAGQDAVAERVRKIREAQDTGVSRAEGWRRRGTAAARADLHDLRDADPVLVHPLLLDVVLEPCSSRVTSVRGTEQLRRGGAGQPVLAGGAQHRHPDRRRRARLGAARPVDRTVAGSGIPGTRGGANAAHHAVPDHSRCGGADLEDHDPRSHQRHLELGAVSGGYRPGGLDRSVPADDGDGRTDLAVDAFHDAADPRRPPVDASRHPGGRPSRRCGRVSTLP